MHRLRFSTACEIFLDQGSNPCLLHQQVDSLPLSHQGSPYVSLNSKKWVHASPAKICPCFRILISKCFPVLIQK